MRSIYGHSKALSMYFSGMGVTRGRWYTTNFETWQGAGSLFVALKMLGHQVPKFTLDCRFLYLPLTL